MSDIVFRATTQLLFGEKFLARHGWQRLKQNLQTLDDNFDLAVGQQRNNPVVIKHVGQDGDTVGQELDTDTKNYSYSHAGITNTTHLPGIFFESKKTFAICDSRVDFERRLWRYEGAIGEK